MRKIAVKRLSSSDLTFFDSHFKRPDNSSNQKSINLNADCLAGELYPDLAAIRFGMKREIPVNLTILGPVSVSPHRVPRSVARGEAYKNWRLNGAAVPDPETESGRYDALRKDDIVVMEFHGTSEPEAVTLVFVAQDLDPKLHSELAAFVAGGRRTMVRVGPDALDAAVRRAEAVKSHPIFSVVELTAAEAEDIEAAAEGDVAAFETVSASRVGRAVSSDELATSKQAAAAIGQDGEALVAIHLEALQAEGRIIGFDWLSRENAISPADFRVREPNGVEVLVEVKSTGGPFERPVRMSMAELQAAAEGQKRYDVWRVFGINEAGASISKQHDVRAFARGLIGALVLPGGVRATNFALDPAAFGDGWTDAEPVSRPDDDDKDAAA